MSAGILGLGNTAVKLMNSAPRFSGAARSITTGGSSPASLTAPLRCDGRIAMPKHHDHHEHPVDRADKKLNLRKCSGARKEAMSRTLASTIANPSKLRAFRRADVLVRFRLRG